MERGPDNACAVAFYLFVLFHFISFFLKFFFFLLHLAGGHYIFYLFCSPVRNQSTKGKRSQRDSGNQLWKSINTNNNSSHLSSPLLPSPPAKEGLCGVKTGEFDQSSVLRCRILESILSPRNRPYPPYPP